MEKQSQQFISRRTFIKSGVLGMAVLALPIPKLQQARAAELPSNRINIGCIGVGRMGLGDLRNVLRFGHVQIVAVCDVDQWRANHAVELVETHYAKQKKNGQYHGCGVHGDYRELIARPDIDAVIVAVPDHWHFLIAAAAVRAGKDVYIEKPLTLTLQEGRLLSDAVSRYGAILQVGSQQRSDILFRSACEWVRNGRIGRLHTVNIGLHTDPSMPVETPMPVPPSLNYSMWLGPAPWAPYSINRVHPQQRFGRPGWLRISDYCLGMITGWGSHHLDIAHWAMDVEHSGPVAVTGWGEFPKDGLWNVHGSFDLDYRYASGVKMRVSDTFRKGIHFEGDKGWIYVQRGFIDAFPKSILRTPTKSDEIHLYRSDDHMGNFIDCIRTRNQPISSAEISHRSGSACILGDIAMRLRRPLKWNPDTESFVNDADANRMLSRADRSAWML